MAEGYDFENPVYDDDYDFDENTPIYTGEDTPIDTGEEKYGKLPSEYSYVKPGEEMEKPAYAMKKTVDETKKPAELLEELPKDEFGLPDVLEEKKKLKLVIFTN